jgi:eukaryotic-like serine/threonine-protein kinase
LAQRAEKGSRRSVAEEESMESGLIVAGKYRLNQLLGSGGMAEVWSATNTFTERQIAIKFMSPHVAKTPEAAARFLKEAKVSARINHPNIIDIHDVGQTEHGQLFLVMELLTGFPLEVALKRQTPPMTVYEFTLVMIEVSEALVAAHKSGIVHRDLKPTNIFLHKVRDGVAMPKLLDFGVSKFLEDDQNHALTVAGTVLGSPLYMSPEQARGEAQLDGRTDVFAFGAILFEALCGYRSYEAKNFNALIVKIATTKPKDIDACAPHVPESLRAVVRACLETDPLKRAPSFEVVGPALRAALPELETSPLRLPMPLIPTAVVDPDATNALPVVRASDRPPPHDTPRSGSGTLPGSLSTSLPPGAVPPYPTSGPTGPSWHTPNTSYASITTTLPRKRPSAWLFVTAGALVVAAGITGAAFASRAGSAASTTTSAATLHLPPDPPPAEVVTGQPATDDLGPQPAAANAPGETPVVSVDALPGAARPGRSPSKGSGRLVVTATRGWCALNVDGADRGPTPHAAIDLPAGSHDLECRAPDGTVKKTSVAIREGATVKHTFSFD